MNLPPPTEVECYWVVPGKLLAGEYPAHMDRPFVEDFIPDPGDTRSVANRADRRLDALLDAGIDTFFDLTRAGELRPYYPRLEQRARLRGGYVRHARFAIKDLSVPSHGHMLDLLNSIDTALANQRRIYVHCWGGIGRTGLTVACWLIRHGQGAEQALQQIADWRRCLPGLDDSPQSPETPEQVAFVRAWREVYVP